MADLVFISCDYSQLEARITANLSGEPSFINAFKSDRDFFASIASDIYKEEVTKDDPRRKTTKNFVYSFLYGGGIAKMADTAGVSYGHMKRFHTKFQRELHVLYDWTKLVEEAGKNRSRVGLRPYTETHFGKRRLYTTPGKEYQLVNYKIQGTATEVFQQGAVRAKRAGLKPYMRLFIHDEILAVAPRDEAEEIGQAFQDAMTFDMEPVKLTAEYEIIEERWGRAYDA